MVPMNIYGYPYSGYPLGYWADTGIIFIQWNRHEYHTICIHGYPLSSLLETYTSVKAFGLKILNNTSNQTINISHCNNTFRYHRNIYHPKFNTSIDVIG